MERRVFKTTVFTVYNLHVLYQQSTYIIKPDPVIDFKVFQGLKGQVKQETLLFNLSQSNVKQEVKKYCCPYYQLHTQHVAQQISVQHPRVKALYLFTQITYLRPQNTSYKSLLVTKIISFIKPQCAMKFVSNSLPLVDCAIGLVNSVLNLPAGHEVNFLGEFKLQKNCIQSCSSNFFFKGS